MLLEAEGGHRDHFILLASSSPTRGKLGQVCWAQSGVWASHRRQANPIEAHRSIINPPRNERNKKKSLLVYNSSSFQTTTDKKVELRPHRQSKTDDPLI
jgi:hypothetical protein